MRILTPDDFTLEPKPVGLMPPKQNPKACSLVIFHTNLWETPERDESGDRTSRKVLADIIAASVTIPEIEVGIIDVDCYPDFGRHLGVGRFRNLESNGRVVKFSRCEAAIFHDDGDTEWMSDDVDDDVEVLNTWLLGIVLGRQYRPCHTLDDIAVRLAYHRQKIASDYNEDLWAQADRRGVAIDAADEALKDFYDPEWRKYKT
jgi:hypothetical protein